MTFRWRMSSNTDCGTSNSVNKDWLGKLFWVLLPAIYLAIPVAAAAVSIQLEPLKRLAAPAADISQLNPKIMMLFEPNCRFCAQQRRQMELLQRYCLAVDHWLVGINGTERALKQQWQAWQTRLPLYAADSTWLRQIGGVDATPTTLFVSANNQLIAKHRGMLSQQQLLEAYQAVTGSDCDLPD
jgi:thioredoxin-related protein